MSRWSRRLLPVVAALFALALLAQALTAGFAVLVDAQWWTRHRETVHLFEWLAPVALLLAVTGRHSWRVKALCAAAVVLLFLQYYTAGQRGVPGRQWLAAAHPVTALLLFATAVQMAQRAWRERRA